MRQQFHPEQYYREIRGDPYIKHILNDLQGRLNKEEQEMRLLMDQPVEQNVLNQLIRQKMEGLVDRHKKVVQGLTELKKMYSVRVIIDSPDEKIQEFVKSASGVTYTDLIGYTYKYRNMSQGCPLGKFIIEHICGLSSYEYIDIDYSQEDWANSSNWIYANPRFLYYLLKNCLLQQRISFFDFSYAKIMKFLNEPGGSLTKNSSNKASHKGKKDKHQSKRHDGGYQEDRGQGRDRGHGRGQGQGQGQDRGQGQGRDRRGQSNRGERKDKDHSTSSTIKSVLEKLHFCIKPANKSSTINYTNRIESKKNNYFKQFNDYLEKFIKDLYHNHNPNFSRESSRQSSQESLRQSSRESSRRSSRHSQRQVGFVNNVKGGGSDNKIYINSAGVDLTYFYTTTRLSKKGASTAVKKMKKQGSLYEMVSYPNLITQQLVTDIRKRIFDYLFATYYYYMDQFPVIRARYVDIFGSNKTNLILNQLTKQEENKEPDIKFSQDIFGDISATNKMNTHTRAQIDQLIQEVFEQDAEYKKYKNTLDTMMIQTKDNDVTTLQRLSKTSEQLQTTYRDRIIKYLANKNIANITANRIIQARLLISKRT